MEIMKLSRFKLQLNTFISELKDLREKESYARGQLDLSLQKQKQAEEDFNRKSREFQEKLQSLEELRLQLENKISCLCHENILLEKKQKELKRTIDTVLQSRETFISLYEDSICELKHSIEIKDKKLLVLSEKVNSHLLLFNAIEKEVLTVQQVVDIARKLVSENELVASGLKRKMDEISSFEKQFMERIDALQNELKHKQEKICSKDIIIAELREKLEVEKSNSNIQPKVEELQRTLILKEEIIQNLIAEKQALCFETQSLEFIVQKIQDAVQSMNPLPGENKEKDHTECTTIRNIENQEIDEVGREISAFTNIRQRSEEKQCSSSATLENSISLVTNL